MKTLLLSVLLLAGCVTNQPPNVVDHNIMVTIPCKVVIPVKPVMPLTDTATVDDDLFVKSKKALAEIELRKGYEGEIEAAAKSCSE